MALGEPLFWGAELSTLLQQRKAGLEAEIKGMERNYILNASEQDLTDALVEKYSVEVPELQEDKIHVLDPIDVSVDVSRRHDYVIFEGENRRVLGVGITYCIPFTGDFKLFRFKASAFSMNPPRGQISDNEIKLIYADVNFTPEKLKAEFDNDLKNIRNNVSYLIRDISAHNNYLKTQTLGLIQERKKKILQQSNLATSLGFPLKTRADTPQTYTVPTTRRKPRIEMPTVKPGNFEPEPALSQEDYNHILKVIQDMSIVMEKSPQAFKDMGEENLRWHYLVQLNGHYEGNATAETFNFKGKTDITSSRTKCNTLAF